MQYKKPQAAKLANIAKKRSYENEMHIKRVLYDMLERGEPISINNVARFAGVTRQCIYSNKELKKLIDYYGKYVFRNKEPGNDEEGWILINIPELQKLETEIDKLLQENKRLELKLFSLYNKIGEEYNNRILEDE